MLFPFPKLTEETAEMSATMLFYPPDTRFNTIKIGRECHGVLTCSLSKQYAGAASFLLDLNKHDVGEAYFWALDPIVACNYL